MKLFSVKSLLLSAVNEFQLNSPIWPTIYPDSNRNTMNAELVHATTDSNHWLIISLGVWSYWTVGCHSARQSLLRFHVINLSRIIFSKRALIGDRSIPPLYPCLICDQVSVSTLISLWEICWRLRWLFLKGSTPSRLSGLFGGSGLCYKETVLYENAFLSIKIVSSDCWCIGFPQHTRQLTGD